MFVVRRFICSLVSVANVFAFVACDRSSSTPSYGLSLSKREAQAVDRFKRDRWTDVIDVYRLGPNTLRVRTQQRVMNPSITGLPYPQRVRPNLCACPSLPSAAEFICLLYKAPGACPG